MGVCHHAEYGGVGWPIAAHLWNPQMRNWGYQTYQDKAAYLKALRKKVEALVPMKQKLGVSAAVYTQTTDVEGEVNGLMTYDRKFIKVEPVLLREMNAPLTGYKSRVNQRTKLPSANQQNRRR